MASKTVTIPYSPAIFNTIEDLDEATTKFKDLKGPEWVLGAGKDVLMKHEVK